LDGPLRSNYRENGNVFISNFKNKTSPFCPAALSVLSLGNGVKTHVSAFLGQRQRLDLPGVQTSARESRNNLRSSVLQYSNGGMARLQSRETQGPEQQTICISANISIPETRRRLAQNDQGQPFTSIPGVQRPQNLTNLALLPAKCLPAISCLIILVPLAVNRQHRSHRTIHSEGQADGALR